MKRWTKLKKRIESFFADCIKSRAEFATTTYHNAGHEQEFSGYVSLKIEDWEVLFVGCRHVRWWHGAIPEDFLAAPETFELTAVDKTAMNKVENFTLASLTAEHSLRRPDMIALLVEYCQTPIDKILGSENSIIRGIGMLDRRAGKKRLKELLKSERHPFVQLLLCFRLGAERSKCT